MIKFITTLAAALITLLCTAPINETNAVDNSAQFEVPTNRKAFYFVEAIFNKLDQC